MSFPAALQQQASLTLDSVQFEAFDSVVSCDTNPRLSQIDDYTFLQRCIFVPPEDSPSMPLQR